MEILNIDGTTLPAPSAYKVQLSDLDSSGTGRTEDGMTVQYFFGGVRTAKMYAGDRTADLKAARDGQAVWEVAVNLIEF